jgi:hypothetical protein
MNLNLLTNEEVNTDTVVQGQGCQNLEIGVHFFWFFFFFFFCGEYSGLLEFAELEYSPKEILSGKKCVDPASVLSQASFMKWENISTAENIC